MNGRPNSLAEVAERRQAGEDFGRLLSESLDQFYQAMLAMEPATLADVREHALLGAAGEHRGLTGPARSEFRQRLT